MEFHAKTFEKLSARELYEILKSRMEIFLLEQDIKCLDTDNVDYDSLHVFFEHEGRVVAYFRAFEYGEDAVKIGRVLTLSHGKGLGKRLMLEGMEAVKTHFGNKKIILHSQKHASGFYEKFGFKVCSDEYLEEGVAHVTMELTFKSKSGKKNPVQYN